VAGTKSNFNSKKCGRQRIESQDVQHLLPRDLVSYKFNDTVCDATEAVNYPTVFKLIGFIRHATA
jgi:hypothetical protein